MAIPVKARLRAGTLLALALLGTLGPRGRHLPEPRVIVDELDLLAGDEVKAGTNGVLVALDEGVDIILDGRGIDVRGPRRVDIARVPVLEVNEDAIEGLATVVLAADHIDLLELTKAEAVEDGANPSLGDVREHPRDADARRARLLVAEILKVKQIVVHLPNRPGARGDFQFRKVLELDFVRESRTPDRRDIGRRHGRVAGGHFWFLGVSQVEEYFFKKHKKAFQFFEKYQKILCAVSYKKYR